MTQSTDIEILAQIKAVVLECSAIAYSMRMDPAQIHSATKGDKSIVTAVDPLLEKLIKERLVGKFGGSFVGEETGKTAAAATSELEWIVDPIDGTTNFDKGTKAGGYPDLSTWGISVGLRKNGKPHIGVIYKPQTDELFYAVDGQGAFAETTKFGKDYIRKLELPKEFTDSRAIIGFGILGGTTCTPQHVEVYGVFKHATTDRVATTTTRSQGAAGMELASVACGTYAAYVSVVAEHDIAAARVIMKEAGAKVTTIESPACKKGYFYILASHPQIHAELLEALQRAVSPSPETSGNLAAQPTNPTRQP